MSSIPFRFDTEHCRQHCRTDRLPFAIDGKGVRRADRQPLAGAFYLGADADHVAFCRSEQVHLKLDAQHARTRRPQRQSRIAAAAVENGRHDAGVNVTVLLRQVVARRHLDLGLTGLKMCEPCTDRMHDSLFAKIIANAIFEIRVLRFWVHIILATLTRRRRWFKKTKIFTTLTALDLLDDAASRGGIVICGAVYGELLAGPGRTEEFVNSFLENAEVSVDWASNEAIWRTAGSAFQKYAARGRRRQYGEPRRVLTDFYIGAHALENGYSLLTLDDGIYRAAFPKLKIHCG